MDSSLQEERLGDSDEVINCVSVGIEELTSDFASLAISANSIDDPNLSPLLRKAKKRIFIACKERKESTDSHRGLFRPILTV